MNKILFRHRQRRPDRAVYVPRGRRSQTTPPTTQTPISGVSNTEVSDRESANVISPTDLASSPSQNSDQFELKHHDLVIDAKKVIVHEEIVAEPNSKPQSPIATQEEKPIPQNVNAISTMADTNIKCEGNKIEGALNNSDKDYNEDKEFQRASKVNLIIDIYFFLLFSFNSFIIHKNVLFLVGNKSSQSTHYQTDI